MRAANDKKTLKVTATMACLIFDLDRLTVLLSGLTFP